MVQPAARAGATLQVIWLIGQFHGVIRPHTPTAEHEQLAAVSVAAQPFLHLQAQRMHAPAHVRHTAGKPDPKAGGKGDQRRRSRTSSTRPKAAASTSAPTMNRRPPATTISVRPPDGTGDDTGASGATTAAGTKPGIFALAKRPSR